MSTVDVNDSMLFFVFEVTEQDGTECPAKSLHGLGSVIERYTYKLRLGSITGSSKTIASI